MTIPAEKGTGHLRLPVYPITGRKKKEGGGALDRTEREGYIRYIKLFYKCNRKTRRTGAVGPFFVQERAELRRQKMEDMNLNELKPAVTQLRKANRNRIFRFIYDAPRPVSKQQIAQELGFSLPTIHKTIAELLEAELIRPGEIQASTGGRRAIGYVPDASARFSVGISLTNNHLRLLASDLCMGELAYKELDIREALDSVKIGERIEAELNRFLAENHLPKEKLLGAGITIPGVIDREEDMVVLSPTLKLKNISLSDIRRCISIPVYFENDSTSSGYAEHRARQQEQVYGDFVYLSLENGVGGAIFLNGRQYGGVNGRSAEFGHICVESGGLACACGRHGCLEAYCSMLRISEQIFVAPDAFFRVLREEPDGEDLPWERREEFRALWEDYLRHLAIGISNLRLTFDCDVVIGGSMLLYLQEDLERLRKMAAELDPFASRADYLLPGHFPKQADMRGVAWYFTNRFVEEL